ncbi:aminotransferase class I/II-fold pyridoxal phosphate-dependent enzyme [Persicitalea jodogahamensis]|uniref:2-amino-3-ketobutyrate CoA ligase n=1 Tax=Persicitalea jodogahamensis TaxID=402147 RepID=A0A8J3GB84_9BACT|nr:aminotransferase class I/II-fold pyridoxal phosphate-dependent enzyme [Persicitalea jodogahamensis]GHB88471.1 2-amino-3-ketobutyrate CoA ligase [Persicitalea jodogahamensis]
MSEIFLTESLPGRTVTLADGREFLWFSGTDYLGMGYNEKFQAHLAEGFRRYGTHYGSSRNGSLQLAIYEEAEASLAAFVGAPAALVVSSGMWSGQLLMSELEVIGMVHSAPRVHPALWEQGYVSQGDSWEEWLQQTIQKIQQSDKQQTHVICTDAIGSPWLEEYNLDLLHELPDTHQTLVLVDDSHGLGVLSREGQGTFSRLPQTKNVRSVVTASLNKALGVPGGVLFGDKDFIQSIRQSPKFAGSSPAAPGYFYAFRQNLINGVLQEAHAKLMANIHYFTKKLSHPDLLNYIENYPVFCSRDSGLYPYLLEKKILTSHFSYPKPTDPPIVRLVITAQHKKEDLDQLAEVLSKF